MRDIHSVRHQIRVVAKVVLKLVDRRVFSVLMQQAQHVVHLIFFLFIAPSHVSQVWLTIYFVSVIVYFRSLHDHLLFTA